MNRKGKTTVALLLAAAMLLSLLPQRVWAKEDAVPEETTEGSLLLTGLELYRFLTQTKEEAPDTTEEPPESAETSEGISEPAASPDLSSGSGEPAEVSEDPEAWRLYFGQLHAHTADSDGMGTPAEAYAYAANVAGLDFLAITDHSNSFDGAEDGVLSQDASAISETWRLGKEAAGSATSEAFLALYGFEMTWQNGLGHISTFFTPGFQSRKQADFDDYSTGLETYYSTLTTVPGSVSQFNHPGTLYGDFEDFGHYSEAYGAVIQLLEVVSEGAADYDAYTRALDKGWHVAPTNNQNNHNGLWGDADNGRTVVYAEALTEEAFSSALQNRRVYATEDSDLEILYKLDAHLFGTMLHRRNVGETVVLTASLSDPTDEAVGTVEVIVDGGGVAAALEVTEAAGEIRFELPSSYRYYYLRITQPDGDMAVTAPVWIEQKESAEITAFTTDTVLAMQNRPFDVRVEVWNRDSADFLVQQVTFSAEGQELYSVPDPAPISGNSAAVYRASLSCDAAGSIRIRVEITGTIDGVAMTCTAEVTLTFFTPDLMTTIVADGSHGTLPELTELEAVATQHRMMLVKAQSLSPEVLSTCDCLVLPAPELDFEQDYVNLIADFLLSGRTLILCGQGDDTTPDCAARLNALLEVLGLTARFRDDLAFDPVTNGGRVDELYTTVYNEASELTCSLSQPYCQIGGCTVDPGQGQWLVKGMATTFSVDGDGDGIGNIGETFTQVVDDFDVTHTLVVPQGEAVLLAREETDCGGSVFLSGGMFLGDETLDPGGKNVWDHPNGNGFLLESILKIPRESLAVSTIAQARNACEGETVRLQGYVTAGTAVEWNSFPNMIYIQDETGGLGITDFTSPGVSVGTPVELYLRREGDRFRLMHWEVLDGFSYHYQPKTPGCKDAVNYALYADQLVQAEGKVVSRTLTEDGKGISSFTLEDREGNRVTVRIEDQIASASTGENTLAEVVEMDSWVSAIGIVYRNDGQTVLRVRNCDEIVAIRETGKTYRVVQGEYTVWIRKDGKSVYMEVEGPGEEFLGIDVDGERIDQGYYQTTEDGNLFFRIWPRYLRTLELGTHSVVFRFRNGEATATLVVWNYADSPYTGDPIGGYLAMMILSGGLLLKKRRR